ncbi:sugar kinase [Algivirga pacifica]|uniref:Sugar kinase n=2 Tax=Algivirga pacifica TaxID=1162670 RepID=A0ABP9DJV6_9BACT
MRLSPPGKLRFQQTQQFDITFGGAEANVAIGLSYLNEPSSIISCVPDNPIGKQALHFFQGHGVDVQHIQQTGDRLGIYYLENGALSRSSQVVYDRDHSAFGTLPTGSIDWEKIFEQADWLHWSGITPAVSASAAALTLEALKAARKAGVTISTDLNYRHKLWNYGIPPNEIMPELVEYCDVIIGDVNASKVFFDLAVPGWRFTMDPDYEKYQQFVSLLMQRFPQCKTVAITHRGSLSASDNRWSAMIADREQFKHSPIHELNGIIDRIGAGDSFTAGIIYGLRNFGTDLQKTINFAAATSALKHSILGDASLLSVEEILPLMEGDSSGRVAR